MVTLSQFQNYLFPAREINEDIKSIDFCFNGQLLFDVDCRRRRMSSFIFRPGVTNANFDIFIQIDLFPDSQQIRGLVIQFQ